MDLSVSQSCKHEAAFLFTSFRQNGPMKVWRFAFTVVPSPNQSLDNNLVTAHQRLCSESARSGVQPHFTSRTQSDICVDHNTQKCMWIIEAHELKQKMPEIADFRNSCSFQKLSVGPGYVILSKDRWEGTRKKTASLHQFSMTLFLLLSWPQPTD